MSSERNELLDHVNLMTDEEAYNFGAVEINDPEVGWMGRIDRSLPVCEYDRLCTWVKVLAANLGPRTLAPMLDKFEVTAGVLKSIAIRHRVRLPGTPDHPSAAEVPASCGRSFVACARMGLCGYGECGSCERLHDTLDHTQESARDKVRASAPQNVAGGDPTMRPKEAPDDTVDPCGDGVGVRPGDHERDGPPSRRGGRAVTTHTEDLCQECATPEACHGLNHEAPSGTEPRRAEKGVVAPRDTAKAKDLEPPERFAQRLENRMTRVVHGTAVPGESVDRYPSVNCVSGEQPGAAKIEPILPHRQAAQSATTRGTQSQRSESPVNWPEEALAYVVKGWPNTCHLMLGGEESNKMTRLKRQHDKLREAYEMEKTLLESSWVTDGSSAEIKELCRVKLAEMKSLTMMRDHMLEAYLTGETGGANGRPRRRTAPGNANQIELECHEDMSTWSDGGDAKEPSPEQRAGSSTRGGAEPEDCADSRGRRPE